MKQTRRRRHLRPRPTRSMINQQIQRVRSALQAFQTGMDSGGSAPGVQSGPPPLPARRDRADAR